MRFYRCSRPSLYSKWLQLINRKDSKITKDTEVCSNHFKAGKPTKADSIPSLYLKGYSLNQTNNKRRPPRIRDEIPRKTRKMEALNCSTSVERNEMRNRRSIFVTKILVKVCCLCAPKLTAKQTMFK